MKLSLNVGNNGFEETDNLGLDFNVKRNDN